MNRDDLFKLATGAVLDAAMQEHDAGVRRQAFSFLSTFRVADGVHEIAEELRIGGDNLADLIAFAEYIGVDTGDVELVDVLLQIAQEACGDVRGAALKALYSVGFGGNENVIRAYVARATKLFDIENYNAEIVKILASAPSDIVVPELADFLREGSKRVRLGVMETLKRLAGNGNNDAIRVIIDAVKSNHDDVRYNAIRALETIFSEYF